MERSNYVTSIAVHVYLYIPRARVLQYMYIRTYHVKGEDGIGEVGVIGSILDVLARCRGAPTLDLHTGGGDGEQLKPLHVPDAPAQHLDAGQLEDGTDPTGHDVMGVGRRGCGRRERKLATLVLEGGAMGDSSLSDTLPRTQHIHVHVSMCT